MAISIGGTVVIDDSRNIVNVNNLRVGLVTITGSTGNIQTPGTITGIGYSIVGAGFSTFPGAGTSVTPVETAFIILSFPTSVARGTGTVSLRTVSAGGTAFKSYNAATAPEIVVLGNTWSISVASTTYGSFGASPVLPAGKQIFPVIPSTAITGFAGLNTTGASSYSFTTKNVANLGQEFGGGYVICKAAGVQWIVSPYAAEVSRCWALRADSNTRSQAVSGCTGWFVPTISQLSNPGYTCRSYWGPSPCFSSLPYWSDTEANPPCACQVQFCYGAAFACIYGNTGVICIRSFRCVTY